MYLCKDILKYLDMTDNLADGLIMDLLQMDIHQYLHEFMRLSLSKVSQ